MNKLQILGAFSGGFVVKDLALLLLWMGFPLWLRNLDTSWAKPKKKILGEKELEQWHLNLR